MNPIFDAVLRLPTPLIVLVLLLVWGVVSFVIHRAVVPRLCGADGRRLGRFEAEVTSQIALAFGLLVSFNAVWVWDRSERVRNAVVEEALALESALDEADFLADSKPELRLETYALVAAYAQHLIADEWPRLSHASATRERPAQLLALRRFAFSAAEPILEAVKQAEAARELRIRDGQVAMPRSRWLIVFALALLTLISIGALHGDSPRGRVLALTLVTLAISCCFAVIFVSGRPFVGEYAIQPTSLEQVVSRSLRP